METMGPRTVTSEASTVLHLYVDACCEPAHEFPAGLGGVLVSPDKGILGHYSIMLSRGQLETFNLIGSQNPIFELECMAILIGIDAWSSELRGKNVVVFTDNQAAQASFVKCFRAASWRSIWKYLAGMRESTRPPMWRTNLREEKNLVSSRKARRSWEEYVSRCGISLA